ncbi:MAG: hypothetical protein AB1716_00345 [Planctomycetota bacterium]
MDAWKHSFSEKLAKLQNRWATQLDEALDAAVTPVFNDLQNFLETNGIRASMPLQEEGRRSYKFELAEDAYVLLLFRARGVGEFELTRETFVLGRRPQVRTVSERIGAVDAAWAEREFQTALDEFLNGLLGQEAPAEPALSER